MATRASTTAAVDPGGCGCAETGTAAADTCYCTVDELVHAIARKHALSVLNYLGSRPAARFREVQTALPRVGPSTLSETLRELVGVGLVRREVFPDETPPRVEYGLTQAGALLRDRFHHLLDRVREEA